jgi:titin
MARKFGSAYWNLDRVVALARRRIALPAIGAALVLCAAIASAAPSAPTGVVARVAGNPINGFTITISWFETADTSASYDIYRATTSGGESSPAYAAEPYYSDSYTDSNLVAGTTYYYVITTVDPSTGASPYSVEVAATPGTGVLTAPVLSATTGNNQAVLNWTAVSQSGAGTTTYNVYRGPYNTSGSFSLIASSIATTTYTDTTVSNGQAYWYYVAGENKDGQGTGSNIYQVVAGASPDQAAPTDVSGAPTGNQTAGYANTLTWANQPGITEYFIYRGTSSGAENQLAYAEDTSDEYNSNPIAHFADHSVELGQTYYYTITAVDATGQGPESAEVSVKTGAAVISAPVLSGSIGNNSAALTWTAATGGSGNAAYTVYRMDRTANTYVSMVAYNLSGLTYTDTGLKNGDTYLYYVVATNAYGQGQQSNTVYLTPGTSVDYPAPSDLLATPSGNPNSGYSITLQWTNPPSNGNYYNYYVYRSTAPGAEKQPNYTEVGGAYYSGAATTSYVDTAVTVGITYYYRVTTVDASGESPMSNEAGATAGAAAPLSAPVLSATAGVSKVFLGWTSVPGATAYVVTRNGGLIASAVTGLALTDKGLANGKPYSYNVTPFNLNGQGPASNTVTVIPGVSHLGAPQGLTAIASGSQTAGYQIAVNWLPIANSSGYYVYRSTTSGGEALPVYWTGTYTSNTSFTDTNVIYGVTYYYQVSAFNFLGEGPRSLEASASIGGSALGAPTLTGTIAEAGVKLTWTAVTGATSFDVYRANAFGGGNVLYAANLTGTAYTDSAAATGTTYSYTVRAIGIPGEGPASNSFQATPGITNLPAPTDLVAIGSTGSVQLNWSQMPGATDYYVYRSTASGAETQPLLNDTGNRDSFTDSSAIAGTTYYYKVTALYLEGESAMSSEVNAAPASSSLAAPILRGSHSIAGYNKLAWGAVPGATSYTIYRGNLNGSNYVVLDYQLKGTSYVDSAVTDGTTYDYYLCAVGSGGQGPAGNVVQLTPGQSDLPAPTGVVATTAGGINVYWTPVPGASTYYIYRATASGAEKGPFLTDGYSEYSNSQYGITDSSAIAGIQYFYTVTAVDSNGESPMSAEVSAMLGSALLAAPVLSGSATSAGISLSWTSVTGASNYNIFRGAFTGTQSLLAAHIDGTSYVDETAVAGDDYSYTVYPIGADGEGIPSNTAYIVAGVSGLAAPTGVSAAPSSSPNEITLTWSPVTGATDYLIYKVLQTGTESLGSIYRTSSGKSADGDYPVVDTTVTPGIEYYYTVVATNSAGASPMSSEASAVIGGLLPAPPAITGSLVSGQVTLTWTALSGVTYSVYRGGFSGSGAIAIATSLATGSYTDKSATNGATYTYYVIATNANGNSASSNTVQLTPGLSTLTSPSEVTASVTSNGYIVLNWTGPSGSNEYNIYRATAPGHEASPATAQSYSTSYTDYYPAVGTTYYYTITDLSSSGESAMSVEVSATVHGALVAAPVVTGSAGNNQIALSWGTVTGATSYDIYRGNASGSGLNLLATLVTGLTYTDATAVNGTTYTYAVNGVSAAGQGPSSKLLQITPGATPDVSAPAGVTAQAQGSQGAYFILLNWSSVPKAEYYYIYRATASGAESEPYYTNTYYTSYRDASILPGQTYYYVITAVDSTGESARSVEVSATPGLSLLGAPVLSGTAGNNQVSLSWTAIAGASDYALFRADQNGANLAVLSGTSYVDSTVTNGKTYQYVVYPIDVNGLQTVSNTYQVTPGISSQAAPTALLAQAVPRSGNPYIELTWNASSGANYYYVYRGIAPGAESEVYYASTYYTSYADGSAAPGVTYYYVVAAVNTSTGESTMSNEASATCGVATLPAPTLTAAPGNAQVGLSWTSVTGANTYAVYRGNASGGGMTVIAPALTGTTYTDATAVNGTTYTYQVYPVNVNGLGSGSNVAQTTPGMPDQVGPTHLIAVGSSTNGSNSITLYWQHPTSTSYYYIYRATASGQEARPYYASTYYSSYTDSSITPGVVYYYKVSAIDGRGESAWSNEASAATGVPTAAAPVLSATYNNAWVVLNWNAVSGAASYDVYRGTGNSYPTNLVATGISATTWTDVSTTTGQTYSYIVCAVNEDGQGPASNAVYLTPGACNLEAPTGLVAQTGGTVASGVSVTLSWYAVTGASYYHVYRANSSGAEAQPYVASTYYYTNGFTDTNVYAGATYYYTVTAINSTGESIMSEEVSATPGVPLLAAPTLSIAAYHGNPVSLNWTAIGGANGYNLYRGGHNGSGTTLLAWNLSGLSYFDSAVTNADTYSYFVDAVGAIGQGTPSATLYATPGAPDLGAPTGLSASSTAPGQITLTWSAESGASYVYVYRSITPGGEAQPYYANGYFGYLNFVDSSAVPGVTYYYKISALDAAGESAMSSEASATAP